MYSPDISTSAPISVTPLTTILENDWLCAQKMPQNHLLRSLLDQRRIWKTLESGKAIWPQELEAALLEGTKLVAVLICKRY